MSQAGMLNTAAGPVPPSVPEIFVTDVNSPSIPIANVENVFGGQISTNNIKGIQTDGSSGSNTLTIQLTNRINGTVTTSDNAFHQIASFPYNTNAGPGTYLFQFNLVAYNITAGLGAGSITQIGVRYDGTNGHLLAPQDFVTFDEGAMSGTGINFSVTTTSLIISVSGLAGNTIDWLLSGTYNYVS